MKFLFTTLIIIVSGYSLADAPQPWQVYFQEPATEIMEEIEQVYWFMQIIITLIVLFVVSLLAYTCYRFHHKRNPVPAQFSHNVLIEVIWTIIPVIILCVIAVPSFKLLKKDTQAQQAEFTIKVIGHQWYWSYIYPDHDQITFDSYMINSAKLQPGQKRLLDVDNKIVIPEKTIVRFLITAADVIHSFTVPSFGFKIDAVPGRINETYVNALRKGVYYGQCSEICGVNHGFMPIVIEVVTKEEFEKWLEVAKMKFAGNKTIFALRNY